MAVKKMKNWTRKKIQDDYDFDLLPKNEIMRWSRGSTSSCSSVDRISELPDELIRSILSLLTLREATMARLLSSSWRHVEVEVDDANVVSIEFPFPSFRERQSGLDRDRFLEYANAAALEYSYKTMAMAKAKRKFILKFNFDLLCYTRYDLTNFNLTDWFKSAAAISMEVVDVDIRVIYARPPDDYDYYYQYHRPHQCPNPFRLFVEAEEYCLKLKQVSLSGDILDSADINLILSKLVALERLSIELVCDDHLHHIGSPEITTKLKHLKIITPHTSFINDYRVLISHLDNLVSLSYNGPETDLDHLPKLVDLTIHCDKENIRDILPRIRPSVAAQPLLRLRLYFTLVHHKTTPDYGILLPQFTKIKHLELNVEIDSEINIQHLCPLMEAFPCIHQLEVKLLWLCDPAACKHKKRRDYWYPMMNRMSEISPQLQVVRMSGCVGSVFELEFALYAINNASSLKELVLERRDRNHPIQSAQMDRAFQHLLSVAPSYVDLILL